MASAMQLMALGLLLITIAPLPAVIF